jgi:hypothetical protein
MLNPLKAFVLRVLNRLYTPEGPLTFSGRGAMTKSTLERLLFSLTAAFRSEADFLIPIVDGLGLKLARETNDRAVLLAKQQNTISMIKAHLMKFKA